MVFSVSGSIRCAASTPHQRGLSFCGHRAEILEQRFRRATCSLPVGEAASAELLSNDWAAPRVL